MPLTLPNLDDLAWDDLMGQARSTIISSAPRWTNFNASDPGITLIELFAYFSEILMYRLNRVTEGQMRAFLKLLNGPNWESHADLDAAKRATIHQMRGIHRAVTPQDFEELALQTEAAQTGEQVRRVRCIPQVNLENEDAVSRPTDAPGHFSVVVVSNQRSHPTQELLAGVHHHLEPARLLATHIHVVQPNYLTLSVRIVLVPRHEGMAETLRNEAVAVLESFFDPLTGGVDKNGWPFGRSIYVSEVYQALNGLAGVDYVTRVKDPKTGEELDELMIGPAETSRVRRNKSGELEAVELRVNELVALWIDSADITVASL